MRSTYGHILSINYGWRKKLVSNYFFLSSLSLCNTHREKCSCKITWIWLQKLLIHQIADLLRFFGPLPVHLVKFWITSWWRVVRSIQIWMHMYSCFVDYWTASRGASICGASVLLCQTSCCSRHTQYICSLRYFHHFGASWSKKSHFRV